MNSVNAVIYYSGIVEYLPPIKLKSTCQIQIEQFPFDEQNCTLEFGTWTYDESLIHLTPLGDEAQLDAYVENNEWKLLSRDSTVFILVLTEILFYIGFKSTGLTKKFDCCEERYTLVLFNIHIRRRTLYYIFNFILPSVLLSLMSILGFALPSDSGEVKIILIIENKIIILKF